MIYVTSGRNRHISSFEFQAESQVTFTAKDITGIQLLEIHYTCITIMIDTSLDTSKCFLETPTSSFLLIVDLIETLLEQQTISSPKYR
jgi:hypothetical protein